MSTTKAQQRAARKYKESHYDRFELTLKPIGIKKTIKQHADEQGESLTSFIDRAIKNQMIADKQTKG